MTTAAQALKPTLSEDVRIVLEDRTAHALEQTERLERLLSKLNQSTSKGGSLDGKLFKFLATARNAVGFTRAALEDITAVLPGRTTVTRKNAGSASRLASPPANHRRK